MHTHHTLKCRTAAYCSTLNGAYASITSEMFEIYFQNVEVHKFSDDSIPLVFSISRSHVFSLLNTLKKSLLVKENKIS